MAALQRACSQLQHDSHRVSTSWASRTCSSSILPLRSLTSCWTRSGNQRGPCTTTRTRSWRSRTMSTWRRHAVCTGHSATVGSSANNWGARETTKSRMPDRRRRSTSRRARSLLLSTHTRGSCKAGRSTIKNWKSQWITLHILNCEPNSSRSSRASKRRKARKGLSPG